jgi:heme A synthase
LLIGFLSNEIWERNREAERIVLTESDTLLSLYSLSVATGSDNESLRSAIRSYAGAVVQHEWPSLAMRQRSPEADAALSTLLREVATRGASKDVGIHRAMLEMALRVRNAHEDRVVLSNDRTIGTKWAAVLLLALITQVAIAVVHLEKARPQFAALFIFTAAAVSVLGLLAVHEAPFDPPVFVPPGPIAEVLRQVPR